MNILIVENRNEELISQLVNLWENSAKATHSFLTADGINEIKEYVPQAIQNVETLVVATENTPVAFMGVENNRLEMLFVHPDNIGNGIGKNCFCMALKSSA